MTDDPPPPSVSGSSRPFPRRQIRTGIISDGAFTAAVGAKLGHSSCCQTSVGSQLFIQAEKDVRLCLQEQQPVGGSSSLSGFNRRGSFVYSRGLDLFILKGHVGL